ncbi:MAG: hypothetical protein ACK4MQ_10945 [Hyphomonas sp.]
MSERMTDTRLIELIEVWGADPASWPAEERASARALLAAHPDRFSDALEAARGLDILLGALPEVLPSPALTAAIIASAPRPANAYGLPRWFSFKAPWFPASGFAAAALGLFMGLTIAPAAIAEDDLDAEVEALVMSALGFDPAAYPVEDME